MKKALKISGFVLLLIIVFRGPFYRATINYQEIGTRPVVQITNNELVKLIEQESKDQIIEVAQILEIAKDITNNGLKFSSEQASSDPNKIIETKKANCVGYSKLYNSIANYLIDKNGLKDKISAEHKIGKLDFLGIDIHKIFNSSFFKDHDFNEIVENKTGKTYLTDPSVSDYLWIHRISKENKTNKEPVDNKR